MVDILPLVVRYVPMMGISSMASSGVMGYVSGKKTNVLKRVRDRSHNILSN